MSAASHHTGQAEFTHEPVDGAEHHAESMSSQVVHHLPSPRHRFGTVLQIPQGVVQMSVGDNAVRRRPVTGIAIGPRRDLHSMHRQRTADRLDTEDPAVFVDEPGD
ncbi:hypothetical protein ABZV58_29515 [Nocardia sp. NPDC004654]|uniref:hypothetical protein n=1 Tax=Nocardia sp. NPDC004654 TaxID=3154776 RepID=UPI0033A57F7D